MNRIFYHATNVEFDRFDPELMATKGATNGYLGVWTSVDQEGCETFGDIVMKLEMPNVTPYHMPLRELWKLHQESGKFEDGGKEMYQSFARDLMNAGYNTIYIAESDSEPSQAILIDVENINILEHIPSNNPTPSNWGM